MIEETNNLRWQFRHFDELSNRQLFQAMKLRVDVFVVEQACVYPELDSKDTLPDTLHVLGYSDEILVAYSRAMAPINAGAPATIGRVVTHMDYRRRGIARELMDETMKACLTTWPAAALCLSSQAHITGFYESLGFNAISEEYVEDGIPHVDMMCQMA